jgi:hypothetical protein
MSHHKAVIASTLLLALACSDDGSEGGIYGNTSTAGTLSNGTSLSAGTEAGDGDGAPSTSNGDGDGSPGDGDGDGVKLDVLGADSGMNTAGDGGDGNGCQKVDFLFIIDNSGSMLEEQDNLKASFPSFINEIQSTLDQAQDYHIMVIDTDAWVYAGCGILCGFPFPGICEGYECGVTAPMQCEDVLGAGVTWPRGANASNHDCNILNGVRYMTDAQPNLVSTFQCAASVGTGSTDDPERGMEAMSAAVSGMGLPGTCNTGFLRDDAILVVTIVTDEDDNPGDGSAGTVDTWRQALIDAKNGDENAIVILGLFGDDDLPNAICNGAAEASPRLRQFLDSWGDRGFFGSICASDYDGFFSQAVSIIDTTCDEFTPPG